MIILEAKGGEVPTLPKMASKQVASKHAITNFTIIKDYKCNLDFSFCADCK